MPRAPCSPTCAPSLKNAAHEARRPIAASTRRISNRASSAEVEALLAPFAPPRHQRHRRDPAHQSRPRSAFGRGASQRIAATAGGYSNLEYDLASGQRGKRDVHTARLLAEIAGAESAIVVNNNAAAVFLVLNTLAKGDEVIVSRGELIEIGDGFRIPDIMAESGAVLREVGTTNRTRIRDYERALTERTRLLLARPSLEFPHGRIHRKAIARRTRRARPPRPGSRVRGSRLRLPRRSFGERRAPSRWRAKAAARAFRSFLLAGTNFSVGRRPALSREKRCCVERVRRNPMFRALRVDKLTIAALEATLQSYQRGALDEIPSLRMIRLSADDLAARAENVRGEASPTSCREMPAVEVREGFSVIGGGSTPDQQLPTYLVSVSSRRHSAAAFEERLRLPAALRKSEPSRP